MILLSSPLIYLQKEPLHSPHYLGTEGELSPYILPGMILQAGKMLVVLLGEIHGKSRPWGSPGGSVGQGCRSQVCLPTGFTSGSQPRTMSLPW